MAARVPVILRGREAAVSKDARRRPDLSDHFSYTGVPARAGTHPATGSDPEWVPAFAGPPV